MERRINAYMSVESSVIFSIIILLLYLVIMSSSLLLDRCLLAQNDYVIAIRGAMFSDGEDDYGEVIYGKDMAFDKKRYMEERLSRNADMYVFFPISERKILLTDQNVIVSECGTGIIGENSFECECRMNNPVMRIRECRY